MTLLFNANDVLEFKEKYPDIVIFLADKTKSPEKTMGKWTQITTQTEQELKETITDNNFNQKIEATNWGVRTGIFDLFAGDFEQPWLYRLWKMKLGERAETLTCCYCFEHPYHT